MFEKFLVRHQTLKEQQGAFCGERKTGREEGKNNLLTQIPPFSLILICHDLTRQVCIVYTEFSFNLEKETLVSIPPMLEK